MEQMKTVIQTSVIFRLLAALCGWFSRQWAGSGLIQWFIHPRLGLEQARVLPPVADRPRGAV